MRTLVKTLILLAIVIWIGGLLFFPAIAAVAFSQLPDTHVAGAIVGACLRIVHQEGLAAGGLLIVLFAAATLLRIYSRRSANILLLLTIVMLILTAYSQFNILPRMEGYRIAAGGAIDAAPASDPNRIAFNRLHNESVHVEEGVMLAGILLIVFLARAESAELPGS